MVIYVHLTTFQISTNVPVPRVRTMRLAKTLSTVTVAIACRDIQETTVKLVRNITSETYEHLAIYLNKRSYLIHMCPLLQKWTCVRATRARTTARARRPSTNTIAPVRPTTAGSIAKQVGRTRLIYFRSDFIWSQY